MSSKRCIWDQSEAMYKHYIEDMVVLMHSYGLLVGRVPSAIPPQPDHEYTILTNHHNSCYGPDVRPALSLQVVKVDLATSEANLTCS